MSLSDVSGVRKDISCSTARPLIICIARSMISRMFISSSSSVCFPASILDMSRISLIKSSKCFPLSFMLVAYSRYFSLKMGPSICDSIISEKPITAFKGVRSSWLILARKRDFAA